jgi:hypothetical protein
MAIVFAFVLGLIAIRSIVVLKQRRAALDLIRHAVDRGEHLDPIVIEAILGSSLPNPKIILFGGIIVTTTGVGVGFITLYGALVMIAIGIGLILGSRVIDTRTSGDRSVSQM